MVKTTTVDVIGQIQLKYDPESAEFKEALDSYNEVMVPGSSEQDMVEHVAFYITRFGVEGMVEGVGYVKLYPKHEPKQPYSGIEVLDGYDDFEFEIN